MITHYNLSVSILQCVILSSGGTYEVALLVVLRRDINEQPPERCGRGTYLANLLNGVFLKNLGHGGKRCNE
jgi:hypothetical protein